MGTGPPLNKFGTSIVCVPFFILVGLWLIKPHVTHNMQSSLFQNIFQTAFVLTLINSTFFGHNTHSCVYVHYDQYKCNDLKIALMQS